ncbi:2,3-dihydroxybenzoate-AMP ligase [Palleronia marisminoris]|uniref:2,3-dihydroxybenzoate-AMP ligase n=1 Tax=Palleronia marisminoris TaxID=315423 RepID=A0A1Y5SU11_9RHOB|nr:AMP-binding protein [Palleronia marisminoris]SFG94608.1 2,3-dihydroxybenzoate-AMP ligase [Palleronia marisminoris]SLN46480.1 2,3-dihydroxybenzoate-AMP ligase [Palleronia marisminoris]
MTPLSQSWPDAFSARYRDRGYWRGETFPAMLRDRAAAYPDRIAITDGGLRWSYAELNDRARRFGAGLLALGLRPGDRVLVQMGNIPAFFPAVFGIFAAGMIPVYALPAHRRTEVAHLAETSEAAAIVTQGRIGGFDHAGLGLSLAVAHVIVAGDTPEGAIPMETVAGDPATLPADPDPQSVAFLQISGGSTGLPKLIPRTHDDYIYSLRESAAICGLDRESVFMATLPVAHNFTMSSPGTFGALYAGARVVLCPSPRPDVAFPLIRREGVTITGLVPPLALLWLDAAEREAPGLSSLRIVQVGGAKFLPESARRVEPLLGCRLQQVFGMAEGLVNYTRLDDPDVVVTGTQGRPISQDDEILILDDAGNLVPDGMPGNLLTRGPYTIRAYHAAPSANARSFTEDGFYRTGDIVIRRPSGHLVVQGRANDQINRSGEKISAEDVEDLLLGHPDVFDAVVVSIPDSRLGERACAFIRPKGAPPRPADIRRYMRGREVAAFKIPDEIRFVHEFATTAVGKISRRQLRDMLRDEVLAEEKRKREAMPR